MPLQVGFGKGTPSKLLWVDGIDPDMSESAFERALGKYGKVRTMLCTYVFIHPVCTVCTYVVLHWEFLLALFLMFTSIYVITCCVFICFVSAEFGT